MLFLASNSPRRAELLSQIKVRFEHVSVEVDEIQQKNETSQDYVQRLALEKAQAGLKKNHQQGVVLGADTIVICDNVLLTKFNIHIGKTSEKLYKRRNNEMHCFMK